MQHVVCHVVRRDNSAIKSDRAEIAKRERERETDRQTDRQTDRDSKTETKRQTHRQTHRQIIQLDQG